MKTILVDAWNTFVTANGIDQDLKKLLDTFPNRKIILTNANKTDKAYFLKMLGHFNLQPNDVLYFEHNEDAQNSATSLGIKTYLYRKEDNLDGLDSFLRINLD